MPDKSKKFHEFALKSSLFKGRSDWYFCYLKTERIAHVLGVLAARSDGEAIKDILQNAQSLPGDIARMAAGEFDVSIILAEIFGLLSALRLATTRGLLLTDNSSLLIREYELVAEKLVAGSHPSPFVSGEEFFIPELQPEPLPLPSRPREHHTPEAVKDSPYKGHKGQIGSRMSLIIAHLEKHKGASIKDIAANVRDCSEKTIQRELNTLIQQGRVRRIGSRRWSTYELI